MDDLTVTKITEDNKTVTIGWVPRHGRRATCR